MSLANYAKSLPLVLAHEGGFVNHPKDPGGPTKNGVTQKVYDAYRATKGLAVRTVKKIESEEIHEIYKSRYWDLANCDDLPYGIDYAVFDYAVNSGVGKSIKDLQRTVNGWAGKQLKALSPLKVDGVIGEDTKKAVKLCYGEDEEQFINDFIDRRMRFLKSLKTWGTFGKGWTRRVEGESLQIRENDKGVRDFAIMMARGDMPRPIPKADLPAAIGSRQGETAPGKADGSQVSLIRTAKGIGATLAGAGVTGQTVLSAADTAKEHANGTYLGQIALIVFVMAMIGGIALLLFKFWQEQQEKKGV